MRSIINWKVLSGILIALTLILFSLLVVDLIRSRERARLMINQLNKSAQAAQSTNERLRSVLDSVTTEFHHLETRITLLEAKKDSISGGTSKGSVTLSAKPGASDTDQNFYMNCGNELQIDIPKKYTSSKLKYSSEYASIIETAEPGRIIVFPKARSVTIVVESRGTVIKRVEFPNVKNVPDPRLVVYQGNVPIDVRRGVSAKTFTSLSLIAEAERDFAMSVPKDARYSVRNWELNITRGNTVILRKVCNTETVDLRAERTRFKPGDMVHINGIAFDRITFHNEREMVAFSMTGKLTFPIF